MNITITGPRSVGKSTIAKILAKKMKLRYISSDEIGNKAFRNQGGLDKAIKSGKLNEIIKKKGYGLILDVYRNRKNFVFDLSGGSISSRNVGSASRDVRTIARKKSFVIGLLPTRNQSESIDFLFRREKNRKHFKKLDKAEVLAKTKRHFVRFPALFKRFCHIVVYTKGKSAKQVSNEILKKFKKRV